MLVHKKLTLNEKAKEIKRRRLTTISDRYFPIEKQRPPLNKPNYIGEDVFPDKLLFE